jgi:hypothetical protein
MRPEHTQAINRSALCFREVTGLSTSTSFARKSLSLPSKVVEYKNILELLSRTQGNEYSTHKIFRNERAPWRMLS